MSAPNERRRSKERGERGTSVVEFAIVLPVLLLLIVGIVNIGDGYNAYITVVEAGRDGARLGSKGLATDAEIRDAVEKDMRGLSGSFDPATDVTITRDVMPGDDSLRVEVCHDHDLILPFITAIVDPIHMCSSTTMRAISYE